MMFSAAFIFGPSIDFREDLVDLFAFFG